MISTASSVSHNNIVSRTTMNRSNDMQLSSISTSKLITIILRAIEWIGSTIAIDTTVSNEHHISNKKTKTVGNTLMSNTFRWGRITDFRYHPDKEQLYMCLTILSTVDIHSTTNSSFEFPAKNNNTDTINIEWYNITPYFLPIETNAPVTPISDTITILPCPSRIFLLKTYIWVSLSQIFSHYTIPTLPQNIIKELNINLSSPIVWPVMHLTSLVPLNSSSSSSEWIFGNTLPESIINNSSTNIIHPLLSLTAFVDKKEYHNWSTLPSDWYLSTPIALSTTSSTLSSTSIIPESTKSSSSHNNNRSKKRRTTNKPSSTNKNKSNNNECDIDNIQDEEEDSLPTEIVPSTPSITYSSLSPVQQKVLTERYTTYVLIQEYIQKQQEYQQQWINGLFSLFQEHWGLSAEDYEIIVTEYALITNTTNSKRTSSTHPPEISPAVKAKYTNLITSSSSPSALSFSSFETLRGTLNNEDNMDPILKDYYNQEKEIIKGKINETKKLIEQQKEEELKLLAKLKRRENKLERQRKQMIEQQQQQQEQGQLLANIPNDTNGNTDVQPFLLGSVSGITIPDDNNNNKDGDDNDMNIDDDRANMNIDESEDIIVKSSPNTNNTNTDTQLSSTQNKPYHTSSLPYLSLLTHPNNNNISSSVSVADQLSITNIAKEFPSFRAKYNNPSNWVGKWIGWLIDDTHNVDTLSTDIVYPCHIGASIEQNDNLLTNSIFPSSFFTALSGKDIVGQARNEEVPEPTVHDMLSTIHKRWNEILQNH